MKYKYTYFYLPLEIEIEQDLKRKNTHQLEQWPQPATLLNTVRALYLLQQSLKKTA